MPEYLRALMFIIALSGVTYFLTNKAFANSPIQIKQIKKWEFIWLATLIVMVMVKNIWLISLITIFLASFTLPPKSDNRVFYYLLLLCTLPLFTAEIPGFAGIRYIFELSYPRLMIFALLLPLVLSIKGKAQLFSIPTDKYVVFFVILMGLLEFRDNTLTNGLRSATMLILDIYLPYFAITRIIDTHEKLKLAMLAFLIGLLPFALIGGFEAIRHWFLYLPISDHLERDNMFNQYSDLRGGGLRAMGVFMSPIVLGYSMIFCGAFLLYFQSMIKNKNLVILAFMGIGICLLGTKARGPWIAFALMVIVFIWYGRAGISRIFKYGILAIIALMIASMTPTGSKYVDMLPIIGDTSSDTIDYRTQLIEKSWLLFNRNPWFGDVNFRESDEMEAMRQGQGIIDVVNTFIGVVLPYGLFGLALFCIIFFTVLNGCRKIINRPNIEMDVKLMGRTIIASICGVLFTISTVSSINYIPYMYWVLIALSSAYIKIHQPNKLKGSDQHAEHKKKSY